MTGTKRTSCIRSNLFSESTSKRRVVLNDDAEVLAARLEAKPTYLTKDSKSWYILKKRWQPSTELEYSREWALHPCQRHTLKVYGRVVQEKRWSQSWGVSYRYSGATNVGKPLKESETILTLIEKCNNITAGLFDKDDNAPYNACLQNWYEIDDTIGLHADDEKSMRSDYPIFSLSWGGTRRFLFRGKSDKSKVELWLQDGDLLVMGGTCQATHKHELPPRRTTMDPPTATRINFTLRAFHTNF